MLMPTGFWSYTSSDEHSSRGKLSLLRSLLSQELQQQIGRQPTVVIWQDVAAIPPGTEWEKQIRTAIGETSFIIPIITPAFLQSEWCSQEIELFNEREKELKSARLIFPIHYVDTSHIDEQNLDECYSPSTLKILKSRQWTDFRSLRLQNYESAEVGLFLENLAKSIRSALREAGKATQKQPEPLRNSNSNTPSNVERKRVLEPLIAPLNAAAAAVDTGGPVGCDPPEPKASILARFLQRPNAPAGMSVQLAGIDPIINAILSVMIFLLAGIGIVSVESSFGSNISYVDKFFIEYSWVLAATAALVVTSIFDNKIPRLFLLLSVWFLHAFYMAFVYRLPLERQFTTYVYATLSFLICLYLGFIYIVSFKYISTNLARLAFSSIAMLVFAFTMYAEFSTLGGKSFVFAGGPLIALYFGCISALVGLRSKYSKLWAPMSWFAAVVFSICTINAIKGVYYIIVDGNYGTLMAGIIIANLLMAAIGTVGVAHCLVLGPRRDKFLALIALIKPRLFYFIALTFLYSVYGCYLLIKRGFIDAPIGMLSLLVSLVAILAIATGAVLRDARLDAI